MDPASCPLRLANFTATIAISATVSDAIDLGGASLNAIVTPLALTGTTMTFQGSHDGTTYNAIYDTAGAAVTVTVAASRFIPLAPSDFSGVRYIKVVSGSAEAAARSITLVGRILG